jgi:predicted small metal-binding protein
MGVDCPWVGKAETVDELAMKAREHARVDHEEWWKETGGKMSEEEMKKMVSDVAKDC